MFKTLILSSVAYDELNKDLNLRTLKGVGWITRWALKVAAWPWPLKTLILLDVDVWVFTCVRPYEGVSSWVWQDDLMIIISHFHSFPASCLLSLWSGNSSSSWHKQTSSHYTTALPFNSVTAINSEVCLTWLLIQHHVSWRPYITCRVAACTPDKQII